MKFQFFLSHPSHQIATFLLAKKLLAYNHQVSFIGPNYGPEFVNLRDTVIKNDFEYLDLPIFGEQNAPFDTSDQANHYFISSLIESDLYASFFSLHQPNLVVLDIFYMPIAIVLKHLKIKFVLASTILLTDKSSDNLPLDVSSQYKYMNQSPDVWHDYITHKQKVFGEYVDLLKEIANLKGLDFDKFFYWEKGIVPFGLNFPELIFWDKEFDFPRSHHELRDKYYLGNQVYSEIVYDDHLNVDNDDSNIIYVSLGSKHQTLANLKEDFFIKILDVAKVLSSFTFICNVSNSFIVKHIGVAPHNVKLMTYCPQILILQKAKLMITHAGGSAKECIRYGVPMICYPIDNDQFGVAERISHHQLGIIGDFMNTDKNKILEGINKLIGNSEIHTNLLRWQAKAIADGKSNADVDLLFKYVNAL